MCPDRFLVYGFPIPEEWFPHRYQGMKDAGIEVHSYEDEYSMALEIIRDACEEVCHEIWPEGLYLTTIGAAHVWCLRDGKDQTCDLLKIGNYRRSPPYKVMMAIARGVVKYGIAEEPDWFSLYGMY